MKKSIKILLIIIIILVILVISSLGMVWFLISLGNDFKLADYDYLIDPRITEMKDEKMLAVKVEGDPNSKSNKPFASLFEEFYKLKRENKNIVMSPPKGRWPVDINTPKEEWTGYYGITLPNDIEERDLGNGVKIETWEYGKVAEILHPGSYANETPTIEKLKKFIEDEGYEIKGDSHEEEYLKGPGMYFKGNEDNYYTVIRYRVKKK
ncbi:MAG: GyrI-like domain-containing protein [Patescibacteria group bacterium]